MDSTLRTCTFVSQRHCARAIITSLVVVLAACGSDLQLPLQETSDDDSSGESTNSADTTSQTDEVESTTSESSTPDQGTSTDDSLDSTSHSTTSSSESDGCGQSSAENDCSSGSDEKDIPFDDGSTVYKHVFNLVDAAAVAEIEGFLKKEVGSLAHTSERFFHYFRADYDFVYFVLDHAVEGGAIGRTQYVNRPPMIGTGIRFETRVQQYANAGALKSAIAMQGTDGRGPLAHELVHYWANHFDASFGFGKDRDHDYSGHWGLTSVNGQLGGFDASTLRCAATDESVLPECPALENGRFRFAVQRFGPSSNTFRNIGYAPLELYLMGLISKNEVESSFVLLPDAIVTPSTANDDLYFVEAQAPTAIAMTDILAMHGERQLEPAENRKFRAAFVLATSTPASSDQLEDLALKSGSFSASSGISIPSLKTFEECTGNRATLDVLLGARRKLSDPAIDPQPPACDLIQQGCGAGIGCYFVASQCLCALVGAKQPGEACTNAEDCAAGLGCWTTCTPYCDPQGSDAKSCAMLCPDRFQRLNDQSGSEVGAICQP